MLYDGYRVFLEKHSLLLKSHGPSSFTRFRFRGGLKIQ